MLVSAFILGILGSFHCVGMCGPIAFMLPVSRTHKGKKFLQTFLYHFGRLLAYSFIGIFFGLIGESINLFGMQQWLSIVIGVLMILVVLIPQQYFGRYLIFKPMYKVVSKIKNALGKELKKKAPDTFLTIGFLNGFLPCGLVYMAVFGAIATGDIAVGSLYMLLFGIGTIPLMTTVVYTGNFLNGKMRQSIQKAIPLFIIVIGLLFIIRGMGLGIPYMSPKPSIETVSADFNCH